MCFICVGNLFPFAVCVIFLNKRFRMLNVEVFMNRVEVVQTIFMGSLVLLSQLWKKETNVVREIPLFQL